MDRKRINRWTRWFAIIMATAFALGTVFLGVGSSTGNIFAGCSKSTPTSLSSSSSFEEREQYYLNQVNENPRDNISMLALANLYADDTVGRYEEAITWFNRDLELDPKNIDIRLRVASIYLNKTQNYDAAVKMLNEVTTMAPDNAMAFLLLGQAAKASGQNQTAILAWNRYLELAPTSEYAALIKDEIAKLVALPAVTPQTTTVPGSPGTSLPVTPTP
jgi:tetratricopeptide (TPR) repeat protein